MDKFLIKNKPSTSKRKNYGNRDVDDSKPSSSKRKEVEKRDGGDSKPSTSKGKEDENRDGGDPKSSTSKGKEDENRDGGDPKSSTSKGKEDENRDGDVPEIEIQEEVPPAKKAKKYKYNFNDKWLVDITFKKWISKREQTDGSILAFCQVCNTSILNHKPALVKHQNTLKHKQSMSAISNTPKIGEVFIPKEGEVQRTRAELKLCSYIAQHNLPLALCDTLIPFLENTFPDSKIIKSVSMARTKATATINTVLGPILTNELVEKMKNTSFSIIMDETTDITVKKQCALAVIFFDEEEIRIRTTFLDIYEVTSGKGEDLANGLITWLENKKIPLENFVGFASDTTNSMIGQHNSVFSHLKEKVPHIACVKCSCHMIHLVASKACLKLPRFVEDFLRSAGAHFSRSSLRQEKLRQFQEFFKTDLHKILSPSMTRWLSVKACVDRTLEQYQVLTEYFKVESFEDPSKTTEEILNALGNKLTKIYLEFMSYVLELFTDFNRLFQSERPLLHQLKPEVQKLIKILASNYMQFNYCKTTDAYKIEFANPRFFLPLDKMYLDVAAQASIDELKKEIPEPTTQLQDFKKTCLSFYIEALKQITERFNFADPLYNIIEQIIDPNKAQKLELQDLTGLLNRFPNVGTNIDLTQLHKEWRNHAFLDFKELNLAPDLPVEDYWHRVLKMKDASGEPIFPTLKKIIILILVLPFSNACVERIFSQLKLIKTDNRNRLSTKTIAALMATKASIKDSITFEPTKKILHAKIDYNRKCGKDDNQPSSSSS